MSVIFKLNKMKKKLLFLSFLLVSLASQAQNLITEGFDDITTLPAAGWSSTNQSATIGTNPNWFQGNPFVDGGPFDSYAGAPNSYVACNFNSVTGANTISNWLISPVVSLVNGDVITFYSRTVDAPAFADRLQLRISTNGAASVNPVGEAGVGDYTTLALEINPTLSASGYPNVWTQYSYTVSGLPTATNCKIAFRYFVTSGGPSGANSDFIGVDSFSVDRPLSSDDFFKNNFSLYPNPVDNVLNISVKNEMTINNLSITDLNGRLVSSSSSAISSVDVSNLSSGVYFVSIETNEGKGTSKFVKK